MKRLVSIVGCLFVLLAGVTALWASCTRLSFAAGDDRRAAVFHFTHDRQSGSHHEHPDKARVHCPIEEWYVPTAGFSAKLHPGSERLVKWCAAESTSCLGDGTSHSFAHGPPIFSVSSPHIFLSVLRI
jgi:hypothetical protein